MSKDDGASSQPIQPSILPSYPRKDEQTRASERTTREMGLGVIDTVAAGVAPMAALPDMRMPRVMENGATHLVRQLGAYSGRNFRQHLTVTFAACRRLSGLDQLPSFFSSAGRWPTAIRHCPGTWRANVAKGWMAIKIRPFAPSALHRVSHSLLHFCNSFPLGSSLPLFRFYFFTRHRPQIWVFLNFTYLGISLWFFLTSFFVIIHRLANRWWTEMKQFTTCRNPVWLLIHLVKFVLHSARLTLTDICPDFWGKRTAKDVAHYGFQSCQFDPRLLSAMLFFSFSVQIIFPPLTKLWI